VYVYWIRGCGTGGVVVRSGGVGCGVVVVGVEVGCGVECMVVWLEVGGVVGWG